MREQRLPRRGPAAVCMLLAATLCHPFASNAASLRSFREIGAAEVRLSDLFAGLGAAPDVVLGPGPAPGDHILVEAPQLAAIARDFGVDWRPVSGTEQVVIERAGERLAMRLILSALRSALAASGAPDQADIAMPGFEPPMIPAGSTPQIAFKALAYDAAGGHFTGELVLRLPGAAPARLPVAGNVTATIDAVVLTRRLPVGSALAASDVRLARVPWALVRNRPIQALSAAIGQRLRRPRAPGQALTESDVAPPTLVERGATVRLALEAGGISLTAQALALDGGGAGERIRVENPSSHAIVEAVVTGNGEARVLPGLPLHLAGAP